MLYLWSMRSRTEDGQDLDGFHTRLTRKIGLKRLDWKRKKILEILTEIWIEIGPMTLKTGCKAYDKERWERWGPWALFWLLLTVEIGSLRFNWRIVLEKLGVAKRLTFGHSNWQYCKENELDELWTRRFDWESFINDNDRLLKPSNKKIDL